MGFNALGTDLEPRMVDYSTTNLAWLAQHQAHTGKATVEVGDATDYQWPEFDAVACETYLGRPFAHQPDEQTLQKVMQDTDTIHKKFLQNLAQQTKPGTRICIAVPAWHTPHGIQHLKTLDSLEELGYTRMSFVHAERKDLIYHRDGQIVGRELVTLIRK